MNPFEKFLLGFMKAVVVTAPSIAPIFIHSEHGVAIFNASEALATAAITEFTPSVSNATPPAA